MNERSSTVATTGMAREKTIAGYSLKEFRQPPHRRLPWHEHRHASICFVLAGSYAESFRGVEQECSPDTTVFKPPVERHADRFGRLGGKCLLIEILPGRLDAHTTIGAQPSLVRSARLAALGRQIYREFLGVDVVSPLAIEGLTLEVLVEATRAAAHERSAEPPGWLRRARELVHDSFYEPLTLAVVARAVNIHPAHLARLFRRHYGVSLGEYVRRLRIERAAAELARPERTIAEISFDLGFFDQSHFNRVFRQHMGQTPSEFRSASRNSGTTPLQTS